MPNISGDSPYSLMLADPEVVAAAERLFNRFHAWPMKTTWADLPTHVELGLINYRYLMLSYAWTALRETGKGRV